MRTFLVLLAAIFLISCRPPEPTYGYTFNVPLADEAPGVRLAHAGSAFIVLHRGRVFLLTAAHVVLRTGVDHHFLFLSNKEWVSLNDAWKFTTIDLAAIELSASFSARAGALKTGAEDLFMQKSILIALCNPVLVENPPMGIYLGTEEARNEIPATFREINLLLLSDRLKDGCSGAALIDYSSRIRGIITSGSEDYGYAIAASEIATFLDKTFF